MRYSANERLWYKDYDPMALWQRATLIIKYQMESVPVVVGPAVKQFQQQEVPAEK